MASQNIERIIVNPQWRTEVEKSKLGVVEMKPRYRYQNGKATDEVIGGRARLQVQNGDLFGESISVKVPLENYKNIHEHDRVSIHLTDAKASGWTDGRGFGHVTANLTGKLKKE